MAQPGDPPQIPWPLSSFPGANSQEGSGRLINCSAEPLGDSQKPSSPSPQVWRRQPGFSLFAITAEVAAYRGGLIVNNLSFEVWANVYTVDVNGILTLLGVLPGTKKVSIAHNQVRPSPDVVAVDIDNGAYILFTSPLANATNTATIAGSSFISGDTVSLAFNNVGVAGFPVTITYILGSGETATTIAAGLKALINASAVLSAAFVTANNIAGLTITQQGAVGNLTTLVARVVPIGASTTLTGTVTGTGNETITFVAGSGSATAAIGGTVLHSGDTVAITFVNPSAPSFPVKVTYTLGAGETLTSIAAGLVALINANATLTATSISATNLVGVITILQPVGNETVTFVPASGSLSGGSGTPGIIFAGAPLSFNGGGNLPQPDSVCFQDGYFFFTVADGRCFASGLNSLTINSQTFITCQAKSDVVLLRGITFSGMLWLFTTGSCEIWQDVAGVAPAFPYGRLSVIEYGLIQANAIAGWETGFSVLIWVAQDFGVYMVTPGQFQPTKVSPPDLDRIIEAQVRAGNTLEAGVYAFTGKKFWALSSPAWTWEFNLSTNKWNERWSLSLATGAFGRWRFTCGHPAFNKWLGGDQASGNLIWIDVGNYTENGAVQLFRMESGPIEDFPNMLRVARADFQFVMGVGEAVAHILASVVGATAGTDGGVGPVVRLAVTNTAQMQTNDTGVVSGITGTTEANGTWPLRIIDQTHVELIGSIFVHAYVLGGTLIDVTSPPNEINPSVAVSWSKDGGNRWGNPLIRYLGQQAQTQRPRVSVKNCGLSGPMGFRWRIDISDPVYAGFLEATQSSDPRDVGA
jgi:hypothetical protein